MKTPRFRITLRRIGEGLPLRSSPLVSPGPFMRDCRPATPPGTDDSVTTVCPEQPGGTHDVLANGGGCGLNHVERLMREQALQPDYAA